ncbi:MAG: hypothetical protein ACKVHU_14895 [Acidimicrobiales bacterium]|jgi:hypothetical protein
MEDSNTDPDPVNDNEEADAVDEEAAPDEVPAPDELVIDGMTLSVPGLAGDTDDDQPFDPDSDEEELIEIEIPEFVLRLQEQGLISSDLDIAEIAATDGPTYDLGEMSEDEVSALLTRVETDSIRGVVDMAGQLSVHYNDEKKMEMIFDDIYGVDEEAPATEDGKRLEGRSDEIEQMAGRIAARQRNAEQTGPVTEKRRWWGGRSSR